MADGVTLDFLGEQMQRLFAEVRESRRETGEMREEFRGALRELRDEVTVLTGITLRLEGRDVETRGLLSLVGRLQTRHDRLEERLVRLEEAGSGA